MFNVEIEVGDAENLGDSLVAAGFAKKNVASERENQSEDE